MIFQLVRGGFSDRINQDKYNSNWKKLLGFRNMQEKLEKRSKSFDLKDIPVNIAVIIF